MTSDIRECGKSASRRHFLRGSALLLGFMAGGARVLATPAQARERGLPFSTLNDTEVATLEAVAEALVPGAREAGIAHFIDQQLSAAPEDNLLMLKYLGFPPEAHGDFYRTALASTAAQCQARYQAPAGALDRARAQALVAALAADETPDWQGAPASLFYFVLRSDAIDVRYGTSEGIAGLDLPVMAHIEAPAPW